jgi:hypothetical protein
MQARLCLFAQAPGQPKLTVVFAAIWVRASELDPTVQARHGNASALSAT